MSEPATDALAALAVPHRAGAALRALLRRGAAAQDEAMRGLQHPDPEVRLRCCQYFDHFLVPEVLDALVAMLWDPHPGVRVSVLHTLSCDRCKEGDCRVRPAQVLPRTIEILRSDGDAQVRARALELLGRYVHTHAVARDSILWATTEDPSPAVRKKARWFAPGGPVFLRTAPRGARVRRQGTTSDGAVAAAR